MACRAGRGQCGWAVNHDAVVCVILRHRVPQVTDGPQVGPLPLEQIHVQVAQLVVGRQYVQAPDAAVIQQVVVVGVRDGQQPGQGVVFPRREQGLGGVGLGVASMSSTRWPYSVARMAATLTAVTVFPTPPFRFTMAIVFTFIVLSLV